MRRLSAAVLILVLALPQLAFGWGREGHQIIAVIAEDHLDQTTKVMVQSLIGNNHLYSIAPWADDIRKERRETGTWHYVNIPLGTTYDEKRDCAPPKSCVVGKINDFVKVLTDKNAPREERAEVLKFLVHFVGDVHQPMHAAAEAAGGNGIHVSFIDSNRCGPYECSLHGVWDTSMILRTGMNRDEYAQHEEEIAKAEKLNAQAGGTPEQWANESVRLAKAAWVRDGASLDERYYDSEIKVVDRQMALAGLRLARLLNNTIGKMTPRDFAESRESGAGIVPKNDERRENVIGQSETSSIKVWVNTRSGVYHCTTSEWYGKTKHGEYMTQAEAQKNGYRPVGGKVCE